MMVRKMMWALYVFILAILMFAIPRSASAQGENPIEGMHYSVLSSCPDGSSDTCIKIGTRNIDTREFARRFNTDMQSLRVENPTRTLAVCGSGGKYRIGDGIRSVEARASNGVWEGCPSDDQFVYLIPGEIVKISGKRYLSFAEAQQKLNELMACKSADCAIVAVKPLAANVKEWKQAEESSSTANPPAAPSPSIAPVPQTTLAPAVSVLQENSTNHSSPVMWIVLTCVAFFLMLVQTYRAGWFERRLANQEYMAKQDQDALRRAEFAEVRMQELEKDLEVNRLEAARDLDRVNHQLELAQESQAQMRREIVAFGNTLLAELAGERIIPEDGQTTFAILSALKKRVKQMLFALREELAALGRVAKPLVPVDESIVLTPVYVTETRLALQERLQSRIVPAETVVVKEPIAPPHHAAVDANDYRAILEQSFTQLTGRPGSELGETSGVAAETMSRITRNIVADVQILSDNLAQLVMGQPMSTVDATHVDFVTLREVLHQLRKNVVLAEKTIQAVDADTEVASVPLTGHILRLCDLLAEKFEAVQLYQSEIQRRAAEIARLIIERNEFEAALVESRNAYGRTSMPSRDSGEQSTAAVTGNTLAPCGASVPPPNAVDPREPWRVSLFINLARFLRTFQNHAIIRVEHPSEAGLIVRMRDFLETRQFQLVVNGTPQTFSANVRQENPGVWGYLEANGAMAAVGS